MMKKYICWALVSLALLASCSGKDNGGQSDSLDSVSITAALDPSSGKAAWQSSDELIGQSLKDGKALSRFQLTTTDGGSSSAVFTAGGTNIAAGDEYRLPSAACPTLRLRSGWNRRWPG